MGNSGTKSEEYERALSVFNDQEKVQLQSLYKQLSQDDAVFTAVGLKTLCSPFMSEECIHNLYTYMKRADSQTQEAEGHVSSAGFVISLAHILKGSLEEKAAIFYCMASGIIAENGATLKQIVQLIKSVLDGYILILQKTPTFSTWNFNHLDRVSDSPNQLTMTLVHGLVSKEQYLQCEKGAPDLNTVYCREDVETWLGRNALLLKMFDAVSYMCFPVSFTSELGQPSLPKFPVCTGVDWSKFSTLLDLPSLIYLNSRIPHDLRQQWNLLYSSSLHGESFSTMYRKITEQGPTVLIVKDTKGHIFGGFASESWSANAKFVGSPSCFLFNLQPQLEAYYSSGYNENYMYFNHGQETLPNGLGMGGQFDYFGFWISQEFSTGHSKAEPTCTTYSSPQLSADAQFNVDTVEVWRVGPEPRKDSQAEEAAGSILDKDPGAKAMLSLIDKGPHSEGLRELDATADVPEERHLHPEHGTF